MAYQFDILSTWDERVTAARTQGFAKVHQYLPQRCAGILFARIWPQ